MKRGPPESPWQASLCPMYVLTGPVSSEIHYRYIMLLLMTVDTPGLDNITLLIIVIERCIVQNKVHNTYCTVLIKIKMLTKFKPPSTLLLIFRYPVVHFVRVEFLFNFYHIYLFYKRNDTQLGWKWHTPSVRNDTQLGWKWHTPSVRNDTQLGWKWHTALLEMTHSSVRNATQLSWKWHTARLEKTHSSVRNDIQLG
jgi:hypothetical protein